jgi:hypothetical protein
MKQSSVRMELKIHSDLRRAEKCKIMSKRIKHKIPSVKKTGNKKYKGYPHYPAGEDIFIKGKEEQELDPEYPDELKAPNEKPRMLNEKDFVEDVSGGDLDIPGSELDDEMENIGSEDEENNYYSLGGDNNHSEEQDGET